MLVWSEKETGNLNANVLFTQMVKSDSMSIAIQVQ